VGWEEFQAKVEGANELCKLLKSVPKDAAARFEKRSIRNGVEKILAAARANIRPTERPIGDTSEQPFTHEGVLAFSFQTRVKKKPGHVFGDINNNAPHAHLVEYGHRLVNGKRSIGHVPEHPFMRPAIMQNADAVGADVLRDMIEAVKKWKSKNG